MAACSPNPPQSKLEASAGTYNVGNQVGGALLVKLRPEQAGQLQINVSGPNNYNKTYAYTAVPNQSVVNWYADADSVTPGIYRISSTVDGQTYTIERQIEPAQLLGKASKITPSGSNQQVNATWEAVPSAQQYLVTLYSRVGQDTTSLSSQYTTEPSISFSGLTLNQTARCYLAVAAFNNDVRSPQANLFDQFKVSYAESNFFQLSGNALDSLNLKP